MNIDNHVDGMKMRNMELNHLPVEEHRPDESMLMAPPVNASSALHSLLDETAQKYVFRRIFLLSYLTVGHAFIGSVLVQTSSLVRTT